MQKSEINTKTSRKSFIWNHLDRFRKRIAQWVFSNRLNSSAVEERVERRGAAEKSERENMEEGLLREVEWHF